MSDLETVGSQIGRDYARLTKKEFLARYGHLRPGTYDILSPRYDEAPDLYFDWSARRPQHPTPSRFLLSVGQLRIIESLLKEHGIEHDILSLIEFIKGGIEGREYAKFVFTRSLSDALSLIQQIGEEIWTFHRRLFFPGYRRHSFALRRERQRGGPAQSQRRGRQTPL